MAHRPELIPTPPHGQRGGHRSAARPLTEESMLFRRIVLTAAALLMLSGCVVYERDVVYRDHPRHPHYGYGWR
jgi:hypothetical protein